MCFSPSWRNQKLPEVKNQKFISDSCVCFLFSAKLFHCFTYFNVFSAPFRDFDSLNEEDHAANLQLALDVSEREFGIRPFTSEKEMSGDQELDKTTMITYLSKFYELFRGTPLPASGILRRFTPVPFFLELFLPA